MLKHKGPRRQVFHGGARSAQVIKLAGHAKMSRIKRLERAQVGSQLKHLRSEAFKLLPKKLQTPQLRKAMYDLTIFDRVQAVLTPTLIGYKNIRNNAVNVKYHTDLNSDINSLKNTDIQFDDQALNSILPYIKDQKLKDLLITFQARYQQLSYDIRLEQFPQVTKFSRPVTSRETSDLMEINEQFKQGVGLDMNDNDDAAAAAAVAEMTATNDKLKAKLSEEDRQHIDQLDALYQELAECAAIEEADDGSFDTTPNIERQTAALAKLAEMPVKACEYHFLKIPKGMRPTSVLTARVYQILSHPIDYLELYKAVFRGKQRIMSKKLLNEIEICRYAINNLSEQEFRSLNPHRAAILTWKLMNSEDIDNETVATLLNYNDRLLDKDDRALIHHNPEIMANSWIVEAFNNRNNPNYSVELIRGAKAADADLNRFKLFLNDTEMVPRRLNVFLGLHYLKAKRTLPADGCESFFRSLNHCRYPGQVNTVLNAAVTSTPGLVIPPGAIYEAMIAAHKVESHETMASLSNYIRHSTGLGFNNALPMDYRSGSIYIDSLQIRHQREKKNI